MFAILCAGGLLTTLCLSSCGAMPELFKSVEEIATDDAITVKVDRDCFQKDTDVHIRIDVYNKDKPSALHP